MKNCQSKLIVTLLILLQTLSFVSYAAAQSDPVVPRVFITGPFNGSPIYDEPGNTSSYYNIDDGTVSLFGVFFDVPDELIAREDVAIFINGSEIRALVGFTDSRTVNGVLYRSGIFSQRVPVVFLSLWPMRPFLAEIVNTKTFQSLARHQISLYDLRAEGTSTPFQGVDQVLLSGMFSQLPDRGIGYTRPQDREQNLERTLKAMLPKPNLKKFNQDLTNRAKNIPRFEGDGANLKDCIRLSSASHPNFQDKSKFAAYRKAYNRANTQYTLYKKSRNNCNKLGTPQAVAFCLATVEIAYCIKTKPKANDFNLCVDEVDSQAKTLSIDGISEYGLNFEEADAGDEGLVEANATVSNLKGEVDLFLRKLSVKWRFPLCLSGPNEDVEDAYITRTGWLNEWATCKKVVLNSSTASTRFEDHPATYSIKADSSNRERLKADLVGFGDFSFQQRTVRPKGTCEEEFIVEDAINAAEQQRSSLHNRFQNAWYDGSPNTMEAIGLTNLLGTYRLSEVNLPNHDLYAVVGNIYSAPLTGLRLLWHNLITTTHQKTRENQKRGVFYAPIRSLPFTDNAQDHLGQRYDVSYSVTTGLLNRFLNMRTASPAGLNFIYKPTWAELEPFRVRRPAGASADAKAILNRATLLRLDPSFLNIGNAKLQIEISPIFDPIVYMPPDLSAETEIPNVGAASIYGIEALQIAFKEKDRTVNGVLTPGKVWLRMYAGFADKDFKFSIVTRDGAKFLKPHMISDLWKYRIVERPKTICALEYVGLGGGNYPCEDRLIRLVTRLIRPKLRPIFIELLSKIPAPQHFNALGKSKRDFNFNEISRQQINQHITFFGQFERQP